MSTKVTKDCERKNALSGGIGFFPMFADFTAKVAEQLSGGSRAEPTATGDFERYACIKTNRVSIDVARRARECIRGAGSSVKAEARVVSELH